MQFLPEPRPVAAQMFRQACKTFPAWLEAVKMKTTMVILIALAVMGLFVIAGCGTGQASYSSPSGPVGGGCGVGAPVNAGSNPCSDAEVDAAVAL